MTLHKPHDARALRGALGAFATGVTVITTRDAAGEPVGNTASSFNSVSLDPPLILWSLRKSAYSYKTFLAAGHFAVNVLADDQEPLSVRFAQTSVNKWEGVEYETSSTGLPLLPGAIAVFECKSAYTYQGGDHVIIVGEVLRCRHDPDRKPLIFWRGNYHNLIVHSDD